MKKLIVFASLLFALSSVQAQELKDGVLKIRDFEFKEGTEFKIGTSETNIFKFIVMGSTRMMVTKAPTGAWANAPVKVVNISMKKGKYELKIKPTNFEGVNKALNVMQSLWVTDIEEAINSKEIILP
jgi:hypothetical protein